MRVLNELIQRSHKYPRTYPGIKKNIINRHPEKKSLPSSFTRRRCTEHVRWRRKRKTYPYEREDEDNNNNDMTYKYVFLCMYLYTTVLYTRLYVYIGLCA